MQIPEGALHILQGEVRDCTKCELHKTRHNTVFSRGNPLAKLCIVGEAPGEDEDLQGSPFVGRSGQLLDNVLQGLGLNVNEDIYVCNIIKCRPPGNRRPSEDEVNNCIGYLETQIDLIKPSVIVALGGTSVNNLINTTFGITKIRGKFFKRRDSLVMPTYHPSYILRNGSSGKVFDDFKNDLQLAINKVKELA